MYIWLYQPIGWSFYYCKVQLVVFSYRDTRVRFFSKKRTLKETILYCIFLQGEPHHIGLEIYKIKLFKTGALNILKSKFYI